MKYIPSPQFKYFFLGFFVFAFFISCDKDESKEAQGQPSPIVWQTDFGKIHATTQNFIYKNLLIQGQSEKSYGGTFSIYGLTLDSGKVVWENNDWKGDVEADFLFDLENAVISENILVVGGLDFILAINVENGETIWSSTIAKGLTGIRLIDGWVYKPTHDGQGVSSLVRFDINTGTMEKLFEMTKQVEGEGKYNLLIRLPVRWTSPVGEALFITKVIAYENINSGGESRTDIVAYNATSDSYQWYLKEFSSEWNMQSPEIQDSLIFIKDNFNTSCLHAESGQLKWVATPDNSSYFDSNLFPFMENVIQVVQDDGTFLVINKFSGKKSVNSNVGPISFNRFTLRNDSLWTASSGVIVINAYSGEVLKRWNNKGKGSWNKSIVCHPEKRFVYTSDNRYVYCLDPNEM